MRDNTNYNRDKMETAWMQLHGGTKRAGGGEWGGWWGGGRLINTTERLTRTLPPPPFPAQHTYIHTYIHDTYIVVHSSGEIVQQYVVNYDVLSARRPQAKPAVVIVDVR